jgi:hypothetical protein
MTKIRKFLQITPILPFLILTGFFNVVTRLFFFLENMFGGISQKYILWLQSKEKR